MSPEANPLLNELSENMRWLAVRAETFKAVGSPSKEMLDLMLDVVTVHADRSHREMERNPASIILALKEIRKGRPKISRPALTADLITVYSGARVKGFADYMLKILMKATPSNPKLSEEQESQLKNLSVLFDFWYGVPLGCTPISSAEASISGDIEDTLREANANRRAILNRYDLVTDVNLDLEMKREGSDYAQILKKDPTGKLLIHTVVEDAKSGKGHFFPAPYFMNPEFLVEGVKFAEKAYNTLYPLTEKI